METSETTLASWKIEKSQSSFIAIIVTTFIFVIFIFSFVTTFIISKSTNIFFIVSSILLFFLFLAAIPEFVKSLRAIPEDFEVSLTNSGVYKKTSKDTEPKFIAWSQMNGYDTSYLSSTTMLGKLYTRPTRFTFKSKFEEDNFFVEAFGDDVDILRAYLKENNVPFGFMKSS